MRTSSKQDRIKLKSRAAAPHTDHISVTSVTRSRQLRFCSLDACHPDDWLPVGASRSMQLVGAQFLLSGPATLLCASPVKLLAIALPPVNAPRLLAADAAGAHAHAWIHKPPTRPSTSPLCSSHLPACAHLLRVLRRRRDTDSAHSPVRSISDGSRPHPLHLHAHPPRPSAHSARAFTLAPPAGPTRLPLNPCALFHFTASATYLLLRSFLHVLVLHTRPILGALALTLNPCASHRVVLAEDSIPVGFPAPAAPLPITLAHAFPQFTLGRK
ncbi:hypothetical protein DFH09DRAFT_1327893 [Mycena vulgaris]|nr:hypothetical protein DFH09DRAFT_1327893 [Mycena vulgaris]